MERLNSKTFAVNRVLTLTEALPIVDPLIARYLIPNEFVGFFSTKLAPEAVLERVIERAEWQVINAVRQEERYSLREERRRPWAWKTRRPFRGKMDRESCTFLEKIALAGEVALEVTAELGPPWKKAKTGKPATYDSTKLAAPLLVKGGKSFNGLFAELRNIGYDATINGTKRTPCASELHYAFSKIEKEWLERALARLDERSSRLLKKFGEPIDLFVVDGSAFTGERLDERTIAMERRLVRETYPYTALTRLPTNTVRGIAAHTNRIASFISLLGPGSCLLADPEYDVEKNYRIAKWNDIDLQVKQKSGEARKSFRKKARRKFDRQKYKKRKLGERFFGNVEVRGCRCYYRKKGHRYKGALLVACEHNIRAYFKNKAWSEQFSMVPM